MFAQRTRICVALLTAINFAAVGAIVDVCADNVLISAFSRNLSLTADV